MMNILFVCTGNTCRSPMAEAILKHKSPTLNVKSAGVYANNNDDANPLTLQMLDKNGISFKHDAQQVTDDLLEWAHYVFTMTQSHNQILESHYAKHQDKYYVLKEFVNDPEQKIKLQLQTVNEKIKQKEKQFAEQNGNLPKHEYEQNLNNYLKDERDEQYHLQIKLHNTDVLDPFGGNINHYEATYNELEQLISQLIVLLY